MTKNSFPAPPRWPEALPSLNVRRDAIEDGATLSMLEASDLDASGLVRHQIKVDQVRLNHATFVASSFLQARFWDVRMQACDLSNGLWLDGDWVRVELDECRLTGFQSGESQFEDVTFRSCKLDLSNFRLAVFGSSLFEGCNLRSADFQGCKMSRVRFVDCDLSGARFDRSKLSEVDLRTSRVVEMATVEGLSGAVIDSGQAIELALQLATAIGLSVNDQLTE